MLKKYFTIDEAVNWLSKKTNSEFSKNDLLRLNEKGHVPIYFEYKGNIGIFNEYSNEITPILFPRAILLIYFNGIVKSSSTCQRNTITTIDKFAEIEPILQRSESKSDFLIVNKITVIPSEIIHSSPEFNETLTQFNDKEIFIGRVKSNNKNQLDRTTKIPESEWLFEISDLLAFTSSSTKNFSQGFTKLERQILKIIEEARIAGYDPLKIETGGKQFLKRTCKVKHKDLFGWGDSPFENAWKRAVRSTPPRLRMLNHNIFTKV